MILKYDGEKNKPNKLLCKWRLLLFNSVLVGGACYQFGANFPTLVLLVPKLGRVRLTDPWAKRGHIMWEHKIYAIFALKL